VDNGVQIRLTNEGQPGTNGGPNGNLFLSVTVTPHKFFKRRSDDILLDLDINVAQATLGSEIEVPTVDGVEKLNIPAGTQPGKVLTLKRKGVFRLRKNGRGDEFVIVNVGIPSKLSKEQRELFEQLAASLSTTPKPQQRGFLDKLNDFIGG
jgi:molecular chaperone DnaJ